MWIFADRPLPGPPSPRAGGSVRRGGRLPLLPVVLFTLTCPLDARGISALGTQELTYEDAETRVIVEEARAALAGQREGIENYEARIHERGYLGVGGPRMSRTRPLFERRRVGRVRWEAGGREMVRWEGARESVLGVGSDEEEWAAEGLAESLADALTGNADFIYRPDGGTIGFGGGGGLGGVHPFGEGASEDYRYRLGDTIRVTLPESGRTITLVEVVAEPRRLHPDLVHASLWVDEETGELGRVLYRTARPWNLGMDTDRGLLGFAERIEAEVEGVAIDYGLYDMEWWLPRRVAFHVTLRVGERMELPVILERYAEDYRLNGPASEGWEPAFPDDWTVREGTRTSSADDGEAPDTIRWMTVTPPLDTLHAARSLDPDERPTGAAGDVGVFTPDEWPAIERSLDALAPSPGGFRPEWLWGPGDGLLRYNRVEGLSAGVGVEAPLGFIGPRWSVTTEARVGTADLEPRGAVAVRRSGTSSGEVSLEAYRRLAETSPWESHTGLSASVAALVAGSDRGDYYHADGAALTLRRSLGRGRVMGRLYGERHRSVGRNTDVHFARLWSGDTLRANPSAVEGDWLGAEVAVRGDGGADPRATRLSGAIRLEAGAGSPGSYVRMDADGAVVHRLGPLDLGSRAGMGRSWGDPPTQREFALVGPTTLRGPGAGSVRGPAHWFARGEVSLRLDQEVPGVRVVAFLDAGWAGAWDDLPGESVQLHPGVGLSIADGTVRLDVANPSDTGTTRLYVYLDGVL